MGREQPAAPAPPMMNLSSAFHGLTSSAPIRRELPGGDRRRVPRLESIRARTPASRAAYVVARGYPDSQPAGRRKSRNLCARPARIRPQVHFVPVDLDFLRSGQCLRRCEYRCHCQDSARCEEASGVATAIDAKAFRHRHEGLTAGSGRWSGGDAVRCEPLTHAVLRERRQGCRNQVRFLNASAAHPTAPSHTGQAGARGGVGQRARVSLWPRGTTCVRLRRTSRHQSAARASRCRGGSCSSGCSLRR